MCDFHSIVGVALGERYELLHTPDNSHSGMIESYGKSLGAPDLSNKPLRKTVLFEAEWDGEGDLPPDTRLVRNASECPEKLMGMIREHYHKLEEAMTTGKHLDGYFSDTAKWSDVWNQCIKRGVSVVFPAVFKGHLTIYENAKLEAPALALVGGYLDVYENAKLEAPALTSVSGNLYVYEDAKLEAPALTSVGGNLFVYRNAKLEAPALTSVGGSLIVNENAKLNATALTKVGGNLNVNENAKLDATALT